MDARPLKVTEVLTDKKRFVVPLYQRQYQWHDHKKYEGRTNAFWLDVVAKATEVLANNAKFDHYMGALLLAPDHSSHSKFGTTPIVHVVDGQQRLTTFIILLAAMREIAREHDQLALVGQIDGYIFNEMGPADTDNLARYKLTPTPVDQKVFLDILEYPYEDVRKLHEEHYWGGGVPQNTPVRALRAYEYFRAQIIEFLVSGVSDDTDVNIDEEENQDWAVPEPSKEDILGRLGALLEALVFHLKLIVITLEEKDDAQVIFESLNSKSQPLLAMDLVRNNIFHRAEAQFHDSPDSREQIQQLYREIWEPFDDGWWRENAPNARPTRPRIDHFLANVLTAETGDRITVRELYAEYRAWATPKGKGSKPRFENVEDELAVLQRHMPTYKTLEGAQEGIDAISWLGNRLRLWQNTTAYPIAFQIAAEYVDDHERKTIAQLIDSYLVRRILCNLTPKNLNQVFPRLAAAFIREGVSVSTLRQFINEQDRDTSRFPNDSDLRKGMLANKAYDRIPSRVLADLLWSFEMEMCESTMGEDISRPENLWVEHVMPQSWEENWLLNSSSVKVGAFDEPGYNEREEIIHTLGNLTITTSELNITMRNEEFSKKKDLLEKHSRLLLNKRIAEKQKWDEDEIEKRGNQLADLAIKIWPSPFDM